MLKRSKGYFLLIMLVLTGLAGRTHIDNLSGKERRLLLTNLKVSRSELSDEVKGLSQKQLDFRETPNAPSVRDLLYKVSRAEYLLWQIIQLSLKQSAPSYKNQLSLKDNLLTDWIRTRIEKTNHSNPYNITFHSAQEALKTFKSDNAGILRYIRTTTGNLKQIIIETPSGNLNVFQSILQIEDITHQSLSELRKLKQVPVFPK